MCVSEFRQCFNLYASDGRITNEAQLLFVLRSLGYTPTIAEARAYIERFGRPTATQASREHLM